MDGWMEGGRVVVKVKLKYLMQKQRSCGGGDRGEGEKLN